MLSTWGWQDGWAGFQRWNLSNSGSRTGFTFSQSHPTTPSVFIHIWPFHSCQGKQQSHIRTWTHQQSKPHLQVVWPAPISREDQDITYVWSSELWLVFQMGAQWVSCCDKHMTNHTQSSQSKNWGKWKSGRRSRKWAHHQHIERSKVKWWSDKDVSSVVPHFPGAGRERAKSERVWLSTGHTDILLMQKCSYEFRFWLGTKRHPKK